MIRRTVLVIGLLLVSCGMTGCLDAVTNECSENFEARCEEGRAVNCSEICGQYCDRNITEESCSDECKVVDNDEDKEVSLDTPRPVTDNKAVCTDPESGEDAGMTDAGGTDADTSTVDQ